MLWLVKDLGYSLTGEKSVTKEVKHGDNQEELNSQQEITGYRKGRVVTSSYYIGAFYTYSPVNLP